MTPQEFKAWFEGFTEAFAGVPTKAQWARVKDRVGEIDGKTVTERVFVDRYYPAYPRHYWGQSLSYLNAVGQNQGIGKYSASIAMGLMAGNHSSVAIGDHTHTYTGSGSIGEHTHGDVFSSANTADRYRGGLQSFNSSDAMAALGRADAKALAS